MVKKHQSSPLCGHMILPIGWRNPEISGIFSPKTPIKIKQGFKNSI
jgi:hypothetical protein